MPDTMVPQIRSFHTYYSAYNYTPELGTCIVFVILFSISAILHITQAIRYKTWWMFPTMVFGCLGEVTGWSGRLWSNRNVLLLTPFLMQISTTIFSPSFMSAANFTILGWIIGKVGQRYSWLTPRWYLIIFLSVDLISLVVQSIGGSQASREAESGEDANPGGHIMLYGIVLQMAAICIYVLLGSEFILRVIFNRPARRSTEEEKEGAPVIDKGTRWMLVGLILNSLFLFIRAVYRTIELQEGWSGPVIKKQGLFNWLDGCMIILATYTFNILHPGYLLRTKVRVTSSETL